MNEFPFVPLSGYREYPEDEMMERAREFHAELRPCTSRGWRR